MTQLVESTTTQAPADTGDLLAAIQQVLRNSEEPMTVSKLRSKLPMRLRELNVEETLRRQVAANVLYQYPKYRSAQDRFWDRPMPDHIRYLLRQVLAEAPLAWSELRRKLPAYALDRGEAIFQEEIEQGRLHRHPRQGRGGDRFGLELPNAREYLRGELVKLFERMAPLGFTPEQLRAGALELLHEEEWATAPQSRTAAPSTEPSAAATEPPAVTGHPTP
jgi:hypothetical protein